MSHHLLFSLLFSWYKSLHAKCSFLTVRPWASYLTSLCISFLTESFTDAWVHHIVIECLLCVQLSMQFWRSKSSLFLQGYHSHDNNLSWEQNDKLLCSYDTYIYTGEIDISQNTTQWIVKLGLWCMFEIEVHVEGDLA